MQMPAIARPSVIRYRERYFLCKCCFDQWMYHIRKHSCDNGSSPVANISVGGPTTICAGASLLLASLLGSGNQWYLDASQINNATGQTYSATLQGSYTVVVTIRRLLLPSAPVAVIVTPQPTVKALPILMVSFRHLAQ